MKAEFIVMRVELSTTTRGTRLTLFGKRIGYGDFYMVGEVFDHDEQTEDFLERLSEHLGGEHELHVESLARMLGPLLAEQEPTYRLFCELEGGHELVYRADPIILA